MQIYNVALLATFVSFILNALRINLVIWSLIVGSLFAFLGILDALPMPDLGIIITMLIVGSHLDAKALASHRKNAIAIFFVTFLSTLVSFFTIKNLLPIGNFEAFIIAGSCCLSSTIICQNELKKNNRIVTRYGQIAIIGTVVQDIFGIVLIVMAHSCGSMIDYRTLLIYMGLLFLFIVGIFYGEKISSRIIKYKEKNGFELLSRLFISTLVISYLVSDMLEHLYVSKEIVFFIVGFILKKLVHEVEDQLVALQDICLTIIYIIAGMHLLSFKFMYIKEVLEILSIITLIKMSFSYMLLSTVNAEEETSVSASILLSSFSEFIFFIVYIIDISVDIRNIMVMATAISMIITPYLFDKAIRIFATIRKNSFGIAQYSARLVISKVDNYSLVIGLNNHTMRLMNGMAEKLFQVYAIDSNMNNVLASDIKNCFYMDGRFKETYSALDIAKVNRIIVGVYDVNMANNTIKTIRNIDKDIKIYILCHSVDFIGIATKHNCEPIILSSGDPFTRITEFISDLSKPS